FHRLIGAGLEQVIEFFLVHDAADDDDFDMLKRRILPDRLADDITVNIRKHVIENDQIGIEFLGEHASVIAAAGGFHFKSAVAVQDIHKQLHDLGIVV